MLVMLSSLCFCVFAFCVHSQKFEAEIAQETAEREAAAASLAAQRQKEREAAAAAAEAAAAAKGSKGTRETAMHPSCRCRRDE